MKKKIIAAAVAAAMFAPCIGQAAEWIQLSAWSYAEVSSFISDGLLPESMKGISDYKRVINRGEFCELVYSALRKSGMLDEEKAYCELISDVGEYKSINYLYLAGCQANDWWSGGSVNPYEPATRRWAASLMADVLYTSRIIFIGDEPVEKEILLEDLIKDSFTDSRNEAEHIYQLITDGIMSANDDGYFNPDEEMTVEQAVTAVGRMYKKLPRIIHADSESGEKMRDIGGGLKEEISEDYYTVTDSNNALLNLETDVYTKLLACSHNGRRLVFALNFNDRTDVFDADSGELINTIPAIVNELDEERGMIYTVSSRFMPYRSGLWSMDFKELLPAEYSRYEIEQIAANNMQPPKDEYREADGWIYYSDWNDGGHLYRIDSNGENKQCLVDDKDCTDIDIHGDMLYFRDIVDGNIYRIKCDGTEQQQISDIDGLAYSQVLWMQCWGFDTSEYRSWEQVAIADKRYWDVGHIDYLDSYYSIGADNTVYYVDMVPDAITYEYDEGNLLMSGEKLYKFKPDGTRECLTDFYVNNIITANSSLDKIYFLNESQREKEGASYIYMHDGKETKCISKEYKAVVFGFMYDRSKFLNDGSGVAADKIGFVTIEDVSKNTYHVLELSTGEVTEHKLEPLPEDDNELSERWELGIGNDKIKLYRERATYYVYAEYNGKIENLGRVNTIACTEDSLYYIEFMDANSMPVIGHGMRASVDEGNLIRLDLASGDKNVVWTDCSQRYGRRDNIIFKTKLGELCMADGDDAEVIYPCKGIKRYGKVSEIGHLPRFAGYKNCIYKIDTDGNIFPLTDTDCEYIIYVPNNSSDSKGEIRRY